MVQIKRFVGEEDIAWFEKTFRRMVDEELGSHLAVHMQKTRYFVDFLRSFRIKTIVCFFCVCNLFSHHHQRVAPATCLMRVSFVLLHRFTDIEDYRWFFKTIERVTEEELGAKLAAIVKKDDYFVDFLRYHIDSHIH